MFITQNPTDGTADTEEWTPSEEEELRSDTGEFEWVGEYSGQIFRANPKRAQETRNAPGAAVSDRQGAANRFQHAPNGPIGKGSKGGMMFFRFGSPDHLWKAWPRPYNHAKGKYAVKGKG